MAQAQGTIIPQDMEALAQKAREGTNQLLNQILDFMKNAEKQQERRDEQIRNVVSDKPSNKKIREKLLGVYEKWFIKNKFFRKVMTGLNKMIDAATGSFFKFLKILLLGSIFGADFIASILDIVINVAVMFIEILAKHLPRIIRTAIYVITDVLPRAFMRAVEAIAPALGKLFFELLKDTPLEGLGIWLREAFGPNGAFTNFLKGLAPVIPYLIAAWGALAVVGKYGPILMKLGPLFTGLGKVFGLLASAVPKVIFMFFQFKAFLLTQLLPAIGTMLTTLWAGIAPLLPIIGPIVAAVGALILLWKYSGKILDWIQMVPQFLEEKLGIVGKILGTVFKVITAPLKGLLMLFEGIKKYGIVGFFKEAWKGITKWAKKLWKDIIKYFDSLWSNVMQALTAPVNVIRSVFGAIQRVFGKIKSVFVDLLTPVFETLAPVLTKIKEVLSSMWDLVAGTIAKGFFAIKDGIAGVIDFFSAISEVGVSALMTEGGRKELEKEQLIQQAARQQAEMSGIDQEKAAETLRKGTTKIYGEGEKGTENAIKGLQRVVERQQKKVNAKRFGASPSGTKDKT